MAGSLGGRVHLSPFVSLHMSPVVSQPGCLARLSGWTGSFVSLCLASLTWMPGTALWVDESLSPFICLPVSVGLNAWHGSLGGRVHLPECLDGSLGGRVQLSPFVSLCSLSPSLDAWRGSLGGRVHLSPFVSLHLPFICPRARAHAWHGALGGLFHCLPSFVSRCLPACGPGTALWVDGFICLPLSSFICLGAWHGSLGPFVLLLPLSLALWAHGFICLPCLPSYVSRCLPA